MVQHHLLRFELGPLHAVQSTTFCIDYIDYYLDQRKITKKHTNDIYTQDRETNMQGRKFGLHDPARDREQSHNNN